MLKYEARGRANRWFMFHTETSQYFLSGFPQNPKFKNFRRFLPITSAIISISKVLPKMTLPRCYDVIFLKILSKYLVFEVPLDGFDFSFEVGDSSAPWSSHVGNHLVEVVLIFFTGTEQAVQLVVLLLQLRDFNEEKLLENVIDWLITSVLRRNMGRIWEVARAVVLSRVKKTPN